MEFGLFMMPLHPPHRTYADSYDRDLSLIVKARLHQETGVDELQFLMATETVDHQTVMKSIEMFGKHVIPEFRDGNGPIAPDCPLG